MFFPHLSVGFFFSMSPPSVARFPPPPSTRRQQHTETTHTHRDHTHHTHRDKTHRDHPPSTPRQLEMTKFPPAFSFCTKIRHALVESSVKIVGEAAWRTVDSCKSSLARHSRQPILAPLAVAPGCKHFGTKVFEECRSSTRVGTAQCP